MKKIRLHKVLGILAATVLASGLVMGCDMKLDDEDNRANVSSGSSSDNTMGGGTVTVTSKNAYLSELPETINESDITLCGYTGSYTSTAWWTEISTGDVDVAVGKAVRTVFKNNSYGDSNWSGPVYRIADSTSANEFAVLRNDDYGWGAGYSSGDPAVLLDGVKKENGHGDNWDNFIATVTDSTEYVTVVNKGKTVNVYLQFVKDDKVVDYQYYTGIVGDSNAIKFRPMADAGADITYCE